MDVLGCLNCGYLGTVDFYAVTDVHTVSTVLLI